MFYEEQVINDVLCVRTTPNGVWRQLTPEQLTAKLLEARMTPQATAVYGPIDHHRVGPGLVSLS